jgi:membrane-bound serine protease (ClpP class)
MKILIISFFILFCSIIARAETCTLEIKIEGIIGPGISDYVDRAIQKAQNEKCGSILALMNTPGGNLESTRIIVEKILNSPVPFLCLVTPQGAHAGSAGAIILQACHVNGALHATNIGAATPIAGNGQDIAKDLRKKVINDTVSWIESLVQLRKRNLDFAKKMVTEAKSFSSEEAFKEKAIDILSNNVDEFLKETKGKEVLVGKDKMKVMPGEIIVYNTDSRFFVLQLLSDPQISYLVFMGSIALLYFEFTHPGMIAPGVFGSIGLILSLMSFHRLDVWWGGVALIFLGIIMLILEMFVPSFGALGVGGIIAFILGGIFLFDTSQTAYHLPLYTILPTALVLGGLMIGIGFLALRNRKIKVKTGSENMIGKKLKIAFLENSRKGKVKYHGEFWNFESHSDVEEGDQVIVTEVNGLTLKVKKA